MATATVGTLGEFVELDGDWIEYVERLEHFFLANNIKEVERKRLILLSACGAKTYKLIHNLATPRKPGELSFEDLVKLVQEHHNPQAVSDCSALQVPHTFTQSWSFSCCIRGGAETTVGIL